MSNANKFISVKLFEPKEPAEIFTHTTAVALKITNLAPIESEFVFNIVTQSNDSTGEPADAVLFTVTLKVEGDVKCNPTLVVRINGAVSSVNILDSILSCCSSSLLGDPTSATRVLPERIKTSIPRKQCCELIAYLTKISLLTETTLTCTSVNLLLFRLIIPYNARDGFYVSEFDQRSFCGYTFLKSTRYPDEKFYTIEFTAQDASECIIKVFWKRHAAERPLIEVLTLINEIPELSRLHVASITSKTDMSIRQMRLNSNPATIAFNEPDTYTATYYSLFVHGFTNFIQENFIPRTCELTKPQLMELIRILEHAVLRNSAVAFAYIASLANRSNLEPNNKNVNLTEVVESRLLEYPMVANLAHIYHSSEDMETKRKLFYEQTYKGLAICEAYMNTLGQKSIPFTAENNVSTLEDLETTALEQSIPELQEAYETPDAVFTYTAHIVGAHTLVDELYTANNTISELRKQINLQSEILHGTPGQEEVINY